jgi:hypothetical protein
MPPIGPTIVPAVAPVAPPAVAPSAVRHQFPQASCCSPSLDRTVGAPSSETASRMAASRSETPWVRRRQRVHGMLTCAARPGGAEEQRETQRTGWNHAGQDVEIFQPKRHRVPHFFSRSKLSGAAACDRNLTNSFSMRVKVLGRLPMAVRVEGSWQRPGSLARGRRADSQCSSEIHRRSGHR